MSSIHSKDDLNVRFSPDGPLPRVWLNTPELKVVLVGLEPGQTAGPHDGPPAMYHILDGVGWATVGDSRSRLSPGDTIVVEAGTIRGIEAETRLAFIGARVP